MTKEQQIILLLVKKHDSLVKNHDDLVDRCNALEKENKHLRYRLEMSENSKQALSSAVNELQEIISNNTIQGTAAAMVEHSDFSDLITDIDSPVDLSTYSKRLSF